MRIGTKLICVAGENGGCWIKKATLEEIPGPSYNEEVTYDGASPETDSLFLKEWPDEEGWEARWFVPIDESLDSHIEELVNPKNVEILT